MPRFRQPIPDVPGLSTLILVGKDKPPPAIPPLQFGDRLTRPEFERRYGAAAHIAKAELIDGMVYMPDRISFAKHTGPRFDVTTWLSAYAASTPGCGGRIPRITPPGPR